jgi:hypothetical protein
LTSEGRNYFFISFFSSFFSAFFSSFLLFLLHFLLLFLLLDLGFGLLLFLLRCVGGEGTSGNGGESGGDQDGK